MKLIDGDALADRICSLKHEIASRAAGWVEEDSYECGAVDALCDALDYINQASDGEIVHCENCVYWQDNNNGYPHPECRWSHEETPDPEDFCSFAQDKRQIKE